MMIMQCHELEQVLEDRGGTLLPPPAQAHLQNCRACRNLVDDLERIQVAARELPAEVEPPERVWVSVRSHLEAEKIIRPEFSPAPQGWRAHWGRRLLRPALALVAVPALILAIMLIRRPSGDDNTNVKPLVANPQILTQTKMQLASIEGAVQSSPAPNTATGVSLRENLKIVDDFIASCEETVRARPQNALAREYLSSAYQQKAELLAAIQDRNEIGD
jgi:hypothetical protein